MNEVLIRTARESDAEALLKIYTPYVTGTAITFEYDVPSVSAFKKRIAHTLEKYPYLVAEIDGVPVGYAYAGVFKGRAAYDWAVETSIYVAKDRKRCGIGGQLYRELEKRLKEQHILNLYACIAYTQREDEYLTNDSVAFHQKCGYSLVGEFHQCGYKFDRWYDMVWMEKFLGEHSIPAPDLRPADNR